MSVDASASTLVRPAYYHSPRRSYTDGPIVADLAALANYAPDPEQALILDEIFGVGEDGKSSAFEIAAICARQNLKALAWDTPILTTAGFKPIVEVHPGDEVFHPSGEPTRVVGESDVKLGHRCYRVTTTDGRSEVADEGHLWSVRDTRRRDRPVVVLTTGQILAAGLDRGAPSRRVVTDGKTYDSREYRWQLPTQDAPRTPETDLPLDPYLLGAWLGDGKSTGACLYSHVDDVPHWQAEITRAGFLPTVSKVRRTCSTVGITTTPGQGRQQRSFSGRLRDLGVLGDKHIPDVYLTAGPRQREALMQGLMDTDGTVHHRSGQATFCSARRELAEAVLYLARSLGWKAGLRAHRAMLNGVPHPAWNVTFTPKADDPFTPVRMPRKADRIRPGRGRPGTRTVSIASIEPVESRAVKCIKVDAPDGQFLAGRDLLVTHNSGVLKMAALGWLFVTGERLVVWSAHEFNTAKEALRDMQGLIEDCPFLSRRVAAVRTANGSESIELKDGRRIIFKARTNSGGRGLTGDKVILDEAFALKPEHMGALLPTLSARPDPQVAYASSAGLAASSVLRGIRDRGRAGSSQRLAYLEWCARQGCEQERCRHEIGTRGCALDSPDAWRAANPLLGRVRANGTGLTQEYIQAERQALSARPQEFARERLGWWDEAGASDIFGPGKWEDCIAPETEGLPLAAVGIAVNRDLTRAAIVGAGATPEAVEVKPIRHGPSIGWVVESAGALQRETGCKVAIDPKGPAAVLLPRLAEANIDLTIMSTDDVLDACALFFERVREARLHHADYPELNAAVDGAVQRPVRDRWAWGRRETEEDISPLEAATFAAWAAGGGAPTAVSHYETHRLEVL